MMMRPLVILLLVSVFAFSQTLEMMIDEAKRHNPRLNASGYTADAREAEAKLDGKLDNPMLTLGVNDILSSDPYARDREPMQTQSLTLSQRFPLGARLEESERMKRLEADASRLGLEEATVTLVYRIKQAVYRITKLKKNLEIISRYQTLLEEVASIHTLYNLESRTHYQMALKTEILKTSLAVRKSRTEQALAVLTARLERLTARPVDTVEHHLFLPPLPLLERLEKGIGSNIELQIKNRAVDASEAGVAAARAAEVPDITVGAGYFQRDAFDDYYALSVTIPLTVYDRENIAVVRSLKLRDARVQELADLKNRLIYEMREAYYGLDQARREYRLLEGVLADRREITASLISKIESKQSSLREGYDVIRETFESEFALAAAMLEANLHNATIEMLQGAVQ